ncbi:alkaline phosphatase D family protein, partial [Actinomadura adrarensis]
YVASRDRITKGWLDAGVRNPVVLTGDVHAHWASEIKTDFDDPDSATIGAELVCTSITSGGDGTDSDPATHPFLQINPHLKFYNNQRGYVISRIGMDEMRSDFKTLPTVKTADAQATTKATYVIEDRVPGLNQTYLRPLPQTMASRSAGRSDEDIIRETIENETRRP